jgi:hypothetical protein
VGEASGPDGSPWGQGSYETRPCTVGAHSVGEASGPDGSPWGQGSYETRPCTVGGHSVGEASGPGWFAVGTGLLRIDPGWRGAQRGLCLDLPAGQQLAELVEGEGLAEVVALHDLAAEAAQELQLFA